MPISRSATRSCARSSSRAPAACDPTWRKAWPTRSRTSTRSPTSARSPRASSPASNSVASAHAWVSTVGAGLWRADDLDHWRHEPAVPDTARLFSLAGDGDLLVAGGEGCVYGRDGTRWSTLPLPSPGLQTWALTVSARTVFAGCRPFALLRSDDAGEHWRTLNLTLPPDTEHPHTPRVTAILVEAETIWCGVEVGGVFRSDD